MNRRKSKSILAIGCLCIALPCAGQHVESTQPSTAPAISSGATLSDAERARIEGVIDQLGSTDSEARLRASIQMNSLPGAAKEIVATALKRDDLDPDTERRLRLAMKYVVPRAASEQRAAACAAWERAVLQNAIHASKHQFGSPAETDRVIDLYLQLRHDPNHATAAARDAVLEAVKPLLSDLDDLDPLLFRLRWIASEGRFDDEMPPNRVIPTLAGQIPPAAELLIVMDLLDVIDSPNDLDFRRGAELLKKVAAMPDLPAGQAEIMAFRLYRVCQRGKRTAAADYCVNAYLAACPNSASPLRIRATRTMDFAQAPEQPQAPQDLAAAYLSAHEDITKAYALEPNNAWVAFLMIVEIDLSGGSREELETWYGRAMAADPDYYAAAYRKLRYLIRQADPNQVLSFGRECLASENWYGRIPIILADAHLLLADSSPDRDAYFSQQEVWKDMRQIYEGALVNFPKSVRYRSAYANIASMCGRWDVADRQFQILGEHPDLSIFANKETYDYLRRKAHRLAPQTGPATRPASTER